MDPGCSVVSSFWASTAMARSHPVQLEVSAFALTIPSFRDGRGEKGDVALRTGEKTRLRASSSLVDSALLHISDTSDWPGDQADLAARVTARSDALFGGLARGKNHWTWASLPLRITTFLVCFGVACTCWHLVGCICSVYMFF